MSGEPKTSARPLPWREFARFLLVGVANTCAGLLVIYAAKWLLQWSDLPANALGYAVGLAISFRLNSRWTFAYLGAHGPALARFVLSTAIAYGANLATVMLALHVLGLNGYLAQALGVPPYTLTAYLLSKYFVFRNQRS
jgi:putative flippase GtrA